MKKSHLIFIPAPHAGHLASTVEFAKRVLHQDNSLSTTILLIPSPLNASSTNSSKDSSLVPSDKNSSTSISYQILPELNPPFSFGASNESMENQFSQYIESYRPHVMDAIKNLLYESEKENLQVSLAGIVVGMLSTSMTEVAKELGVPSYMFYTSGASFFDLVFNLPAYYNQLGREFTLSDPDTILPSFINPLPANVLPYVLLNKVGHASFLKQGMEFREMKAILINTFEEFETHAIRSIQDRSAKMAMPQVYPVGPILDLTGQAHGHSNQILQDKIITWLDAQPDSSVIFLCFGSRGSLDVLQLEAVATGLLNSGFRFVWSVRKKSDTTDKIEDPIDCTITEVKEILPTGFVTALEEGRGIVCGWAPQVQVLAHRATGGFVSHCGWNSMLESLWFGKPVATWPQYAEQQFNAFQMVKELELAVEIKLDYRKGISNLVTAEELEASFKKLMDPENPVRARVKEMTEMSRKTVGDGGSSFKYLSKFIRDMKGNTVRDEA